MSAQITFSYFCMLVAALFHICLSNQNLDNDVLCIDVERQALVEFKRGLIDETDRLASWGGEVSDCCRWAGITCDNSTGYVHRIHLPGLDGHCSSYDYNSSHEYNKASKQKFRGNLSSSLLHLKQLRYLDISCNDFEGIRVPSFISSLENLRYLNLTNSNFGGTIPPQLGNLSNLQVLSLGCSYDFFNVLTSMSSMKWLSSLRMLHHLDLSSVDLSKATDWFQVINTLPSLAELHLSECGLSDIQPNVTSLNITSLSVLDLSFNTFNSSVPPWIFSIASLVLLDLSMYHYRGFTHSSIHSFRNLTSLKSLHVSGNSFLNSSSVLQELSGSVGSNLISLDISSCGISSPVLDSLHNLTSLLSLDLSDNLLTKTLPNSLVNFCNLRDLDLSFIPPFEISIPNILQSFLDCKSNALKSLRLTGMGLSGHLPDQIGQLIHLEHLDLVYSRINGTIPDSIGHLSSLRTFTLLGNQISGPIPHSIGQLSLLEELYLVDNSLNGNLPDGFGQLIKLEFLKLSHNFLTGPIPNSIGRLSSLVYLDLSNNRFTETLPDTFRDLGKLTVFNVENNLMNGLVTEHHFTNLTALKTLLAGNNKLTLNLSVENWVPPFQLRELQISSWNLGPHFPSWLRSQRDLWDLAIANTGISDIMPSWFWSSFSNLRFMNLAHNNIRGELIGNLGKFGEYAELDLSNNDFEGPITAKFNEVDFLRLDVSNNHLSGSLDQYLCSSSVRPMVVLDVANNNLSGVIPECWEKWPHLSRLNLENNNLSGRIPSTLGFLVGLVALNLHGNKLSGTLPDSLTNLTSLMVLELGKNDLVGSIPLGFAKLYLLRLLNLRSNKFDGNISHELCYLTYVHILDLANNNFSGNIPRCFNKLSILSGEVYPDEPIEIISIIESESFLPTESLVMKGRADTYGTILQFVMLLDLSNNSLTGNIPNELTSLIKLKSLNLSRNQLTGRIPKKIGDLKALETFDLSLNKLSGGLPVSLSNMNFLSSFNVSYNNLTGKVPSSTQIQSFGESSFIGNKLCGAPLSDRCGPVETPKTVIYTDQQDDDDDGSHGVDWGFVICLISGFIAGFWMVLAPFIVSKAWRIVYIRFLIKLWYMFYDAMYKYCFNMFSK